MGRKPKPKSELQVSIDTRYGMSVKVRMYADLTLAEFWKAYKDLYPTYYNDELLQRVIETHGDIKVGDYYRIYGHPTASTNECCLQCWKSSHGACSWFKNFKPVEGWIAKQTIINMNGKNPRQDESFKIVYCPEFEENPPADFKKPELNREGCIKLLCAVAEDAGEAYRKTLLDIKKLRKQYAADNSVLDTHDFMHRYLKLLERKKNLDNFLKSYTEALQRQVRYKDDPLDSIVMEKRPKRFCPDGIY